MEAFILNSAPIAPAVSRNCDDAVVVGAGHELRVVVQHRGHDAGRAVGGRGDHPPAGGVLLVDGEREQVHPVERGQRVDVAVVGQQRAVQRGGSALHVQPAGQLALVAAAALRRSRASPARSPAGRSRTSAVGAHARARWPT